MHEATRRIIREQLRAMGLSQRQLAINAGMSQGTLNRFLNEETNSLEFSHLLALAGALYMTLSELIGEVTPMHDPKIRRVVQTMEKMPEYKKDAIVAAAIRWLNHHTQAAPAANDRRY